MVVEALVIVVSQFLTPFVPYLVKGAIEMGKSAVGKVGEIAAEKGWEQAEKLWEKFSGNKNVEAAARTLEQMPKDPDAEAAFRLQIKLALMNDHNLANSIQDIMDKYSSGNETNNAGNRAITIGGNATGNTIITGDKNKIDPN